jgi:predicted RND superfamily exporter protein
MEHREGLTKVGKPMPVSNLRETKKTSGNLTLATIIEKKPSPPEVVEWFKKMVDALVEKEEEGLV